MEQKRLHHKRSQGIEAKIPKKELKSPKLARKIAELGKKKATSAALRKASRRTGAVIVRASGANATATRTNATQA